MGVYNPKATMPRSCFDCGCNDGFTCEYLETDCYIADYAQTERIHPDCPLVEVKVPHGRLGDLDSLRAKMYHEAFETDSDMQRWGSGCWIRYKMFERTEEASPTVLEAEGKDDG